MSADSAVGPDIRSWSVLSADTSNGCLGKEFLTKGLFGPPEAPGYDVMLSDGSTVWREKMEAREILKRHKDLNPSVEAPMDVLMKTLSSHLESRQPQATYTLTPPTLTTPTTGTPTDTITLHIQTSLASFPLQWKFTFDRCLREELSTHLVTPLLSMVGELIRRQQELYTLLSKKDKEIQDYKDQGHIVTRRYLETGMFIPELFEADMSSGLEESVRQDIQIFGNLTCQQLYSDIHKTREQCRDREGLLGPDADGPNAGNCSTVGVDQALPLPTLAAAESPPIGGATASPGKRPAPQEPPTQDSELLRREKLEKKLEEIKNKPKKKKRKLM